MNLQNLRSRLSSEAGAKFAFGVLEVSQSVKARAHFFQPFSRLDWRAPITVLLRFAVNGETVRCDTRAAKTESDFQQRVE